MFPRDNESDQNPGQAASSEVSIRLPKPEENLNQPHLKKDATPLPDDAATGIDLFYQFKPMHELRFFTFGVFTEISDFTNVPQIYENNPSRYCLILSVFFDKSRILAVLREDLVKAKFNLKCFEQVEENLIDLKSKLIALANSKPTGAQIATLMDDARKQFLSLLKEIDAVDNSLYLQAFQNTRRNPQENSASAQASQAAKENLVSKAVYDAHVDFFINSITQNPNEVVESAFSYVEQFNRQKPSTMILFSETQLKEDLRKRAPTLDSKNFERLAFRIINSINFAKTQNAQGFIEYILSLGQASPGEEKSRHPNQMQTKSTRASAKPRISVAATLITPEDSALLTEGMDKLSFSSLTDECKLPPCTVYPGYRELNMYATGTTASSSVSPTSSSSAAPEELEGIVPPAPPPPSPTGRR